MSALDLWFEVSRFLFREADLLDAGEYGEWLALFTPDCRYWAPARATRHDRALTATDDGGMPIFDDDHAFLTARVERARHDLAHAERPPSRTRRLITNIIAAPADPGSDGVERVGARSSFLIHQSRLERVETHFVGRREDVLRRVDGALRIQSRAITLDHNVLPRSLSVLF